MHAEASFFCEHSLFRTRLKHSGKKKKGAQGNGWITRNTKQWLWAEVSQRTGSCACVSVWMRKREISGCDAYTNNNLNLRSIIYGMWLLVIRISITLRPRSKIPSYIWYNTMYCEAVQWVCVPGWFTELLYCGTVNSQPHQRTTLAFMTVGCPVLHLHRVWFIFFLCQLSCHFIKHAGLL